MSFYLRILICVLIVLFFVQLGALMWVFDAYPYAVISWIVAIGLAIVTFIGMLEHRKP